MSFEAILTVITIVLAVLAIIPQERGEDLRIRFGGTSAAVVTVATGLVLYWSLMGPLHALPLLRRIPRFVPWLNGWDPASSSLAIFLLATGYSWWCYRRRIPVGRLPKFATALTNALTRRRFAECMHLLEAHFEPIRSGLDGSCWQSRLRKHLFPTNAELHLEALTTPRIKDSSPMPTMATNSSPSQPAKSRAIVTSVPPLHERSRLIQRFVAWAERPTDAAHNVVRSVSLSPPLVRHIASTNPYLGLALSQLPSTWLKREFTETFARALIADPESVIYRELRRAENIDFNNVPVVDRVEQPLLSALCDDSLRREGPQLLYTYLEAGIDALGINEGKVLRNELNRPIGDYYERARWISPPFVTIYLLEITAPRNAVAAGAQSLNLYVLSSLVNALLQQLSPSDDVDLTREWPTPSHYLIYECVSLLVDVVDIWRDRPSDLPQNKLAEEYEGLPDILPAHAIDVLSSVMYTILRSPKLDARFKGYLLEVWWKAYWEKYKEPWSHSDTVLSRLVRGGRFAADDMKHREGLEEAIEHIDTMTQISEGGDRVRAAFGLPPR